MQDVDRLELERLLDELLQDLSNFQGKFEEAAMYDATTYYFYDILAATSEARAQLYRIRAMLV